MKLIFLLSAFCFLIFTSPASGQQFKWVTGGGTSQNVDRSNAWNAEGTYKMCTDPNGNIYALNEVGYFPISADTFHSPGYVGSYSNILLTSYTCSGQMRFAKFIGASNESVPFGIVADSQGHIYVGGFFEDLNGSQTLLIGNDTAIRRNVYHTSAMLQFDTLGHFNWIRFVGDSTMATLRGLSYLGCNVCMDGSDNVHLTNYMASGVHLNGSVTSVGGTYDLTYNSSGVLLDVKRLQIDSTWLVESTAIDANSGTLYATGEKDVNFGTDQFFAAAFDGSRNQVWMYLLDTANGTATSFLSGVSDDNQGHLYFCGGALSSTLSRTVFKFRSDSVINAFGGVGGVSIIMKTDTSANPMWIKNYTGNSQNTFVSLTLVQNKQIAAVGLHWEQVIYGSDTIDAGVGYDPFFAVVDTAGYHLALKNIHGDGYYDIANVVTSDNKGNLYIGGQVEDSIGAPGIPAYHSVGGNTDFFVMKYGYDCNCVAPASNYSYSGSGPISFSYSGSTTGLDSVVWNFGDGSTGSGTTTTHSYATPGTYTVCATVYTDCGSDTHCGSVTVTVSVPAVASFPGISIYPNPVSNALFITGAPSGTTVKLYDVMGREVYTGITTGDKLVINTADLRVGVYALKLTDKTGHILSRNIVKQ